jgi:hypothetical protein
MSHSICVTSLSRAALICALLNARDDTNQPPISGLVTPSRLSQFATQLHKDIDDPQLLSSLGLGVRLYCRSRQTRVHISDTPLSGQPLPATMRAAIRHLRSTGSVDTRHLARSKEAQAQASVRATLRFEWDEELHYHSEKDGTLCLQFSGFSLIEALKVLYTSQQARLSEQEICQNKKRFAAKNSSQLGAVERWMSRLFDDFGIFIEVLPSVNCGRYGMRVFNLPCDGSGRFNCEIERYLTVRGSRRSTLFVVVVSGFLVSTCALAAMRMSL